MTASDVALFLAIQQMMRNRRTDVTNLLYRGQQINLDGFNWKGCRFDGCTLTTNQGNFTMTRCFLDNQTTLLVSVPTARIIRLLNAAQFSEQTFPQLYPVRNADGSVTIPE